MFYIATFIIRFICKLNKNNENQVNCLVVDDTMIERCRGKKVELLSRQYNHVIGKTGGTSYSRLLAEYRETFLNIDMLIIEDLSDLFMQLW